MKDPLDIPDLTLLSSLTPEQLDNLSLGLERSFGMKIRRDDTLFMLTIDGRTEIALAAGCTVIDTWNVAEACNRRLTA